MINLIFQKLGNNKNKLLENKNLINLDMILIFLRLHVFGGLFFWTNNVHS